MSQRPAVPRWVRWAMARLLSERELRIALSELAELHEAWRRTLGRGEADRRYLGQLRQYPLRLILRRLASLRGSVKAWLGVMGLRQAMRSIARAPGMTGAIVLTVGLGIGGCVTVFAIVDTLYLRPLAYPDAERLAWIYTAHPPSRFPLSVADYQALEAQQTSFTAVGAFRDASGALLVAGEPERISYRSPTPSLFPLLGVSPLSGRFPSADEGLGGAEPTALVTLGFAQGRLGAGARNGSDRLGATLELDGVSYRIVGVLPDELGTLGRGPGVYPTLRMGTPARRGPFFLRVIGRLRPDVSPSAANEELQRLNRALLPVWIDSYREAQSTWGMLPVADILRGDAGSLVATLMAAVVLLLAIAVFNAAGLLAARVGGRRRELAIRTALGASGAQITGHLLVESTVLAVAGVSLGVASAAAALDVLPSVAGSYLPRLDEAGLSGSVLGFAAALAIGCGVLFTALPAMARRTGGAIRALSGISRGRAGTPREHRARRVLVAGQIAVTLPLLAAAGLLLSSFARLQRVDPGFRADGLLTVRVSLPAGRHPEPDARLAVWERIAESVTGLPGVTAAGYASGRPPSTFGDTNNFDLEDRPTPEGQNQPVANWLISDAAYFQALGIPLLEGRLLTPEDQVSGESVVVVDEAWARRWFPEGSAVGRRMHEGGSDIWTTVVGVVGEVPYRGPGVETGGTVYAPWLATIIDAYLAVRVDGDPAAMTRAVVEEVHRVDATAPVTGIETGVGLVRAALAEPRHLALVLASFAVVALLLSVVGLYGVTAQRVQRQRADIAVRLALGGPKASVMREILVDGLRLAGLGLAAGLALTAATTGSLERLLYDVRPLDPATLTSAAALLLSISMAASFVPALRALSVDPASTLREE
jgi:putative ABC transport system permease protein